jgi:hypothetical protein
MEQEEERYGRLGLGSSSRFPALTISHLSPPFLHPLLFPLLVISYFSSELPLQVPFIFHCINTARYSHSLSPHTFTAHP